jgi:amidase
MTLTTLSVTALAAAIRDRRSSAREVVEAHLRRIETVNPKINAVVTLDAPGALEAADRADRELARGGAVGPLHGVPFTLKDMHETAGVRTTMGLRALADNVSGEDGVIAARLKRAGAILLGKTNLSMSIQTNSELFGRTSNPYDVGRASGGSSGGAASAVAARLVPFDIGTDLSGSIRMPSHFCGVFGLKPTPQRIPLTGMIWGPPGTPRPDRILAAAGPMARTADDVELLFGVLAGPDPRDPDVPPVPVRAVERPEPRALRVAVVPNIDGIRAAHSIAETVRDVGERLARAGARVEETTLPFAFEEMLFALRRLFVATFAGMGAANAPPGSPVTALQLPSSLDFFATLAEREGFVMKLEAFLSNYDVLICPAAIVPAFPHTERGAPIDVDGSPASSTTVDHPALVATYTGAPSLVVPARLDPDGLPLSVQCIAKRFHDEELIAIGRTIAELLGPLPAPPL